MTRILAATGIAVLLSGACWAQTSDTTTQPESLADNPPAINVRGGAVQSRAPGRIVEAAIGRYVQAKQDRLAAQRSRDTSTLANFDTSAAANSTGGSLSNLLGGATSGLLNTLLGSGLAGSLTGSNTGGALSGGNLVRPGSGNAGSTGTATGGSSSLPPEVIQMLQAFGIDPGSLNLNTGGGATARAKSPTLTQQTANPPTQQQPRFIVRWANAMLSTMFTAITVGMSQQSFIDLLKSGIKAAIEPFTMLGNNDATAGGSQSDGSAADSGSSSSGDSGGSSSGGDSSGGSSGGSSGDGGNPTI